MVRRRDDKVFCNIKKFSNLFSCVTVHIRGAKRGRGCGCLNLYKTGGWGEAPKAMVPLFVNSYFLVLV